MASEDTTAPETDPQISFKVKTSSDGNHTITMSQAATVLDLKTRLSGDDYEKVPADRQRLIYSGRVMKNEDPLSKYNIKAGNTIHMVKSAQSNIAQNPANSATAAPAGGSAPRAAPGVPTNMAAGTANNPLAGLTGARYAGHMALPGADMFGADGGMGAPPSEEAFAQMLDDPNMQQTINEALNNPAMIDMMIQSTPGLRNNPHAREMLASPEFRRMMTNPEALRQAAQLRRMMGGAGGAGAFPAPGVTDTTPAGAAGSNATPNANTPPVNPFPMFAGAGAGAGAAGNPFASLFGQTPTQTPQAPGSAGQSTPSTTDASANAANPFASLFGGAGGAGGANPFGMQGMPPVTPEMLQQFNQMMQQAGGGGGNDLFGFGAANPTSPPPPADTRPPEERYADQLRQLNDMGFFDFDRNVEALRRSGGSVQGAIEQLLS
ncbi:hypothetical protein G7Y89_g2647 [Cudoniella acicularis]|uniref:Uncharacterized protein n=1 Tax=Cudoniella acicularis TaxID=354080 RepID=A0A8H4RSW8_9HELO|nr:hypothetical protein G7Y89_g2647 [Cudoniella acicularis]